MFNVACALQRASGKKAKQFLPRNFWLGYIINFISKISQASRNYLAGFLLMRLLNIFKCITEVILYNLFLYVCVFTPRGYKHEGKNLRSHEIRRVESNIIRKKY
jgi:hypothetical protein